MKNYSILIGILFFCISCSNRTNESTEDFPNASTVNFFVNQYLNLDIKARSENMLYPVQGNELKYAEEVKGQRMDWTIGFYPGVLWYLSNLSENKKITELAKNRTDNLITFLSGKKPDHDIGFIANCSFGNGILQNYNKDNYKGEMIKWADELVKRYNPKVKCFQSWDLDSPWIEKKGWNYPVIIDNLMNLELLFVVSQITGDSSYAKLANSHATTTMRNHFRDDFSSFHLVDYDSTTGKVIQKITVQGYSDESAWSRGQAWGLYGYTMCYHFTKNKDFLQHAKGIADFILKHPSLPKDKVPYWDFNSPDIPNASRDASSAAIIASALLELSKYDLENSTLYFANANKILRSLTEKYTSSKEEYFILQHSVGSFPAGASVDQPVVYADYYYLEALVRLKNLEKENR